MSQIRQQIEIVGKIDDSALKLSKEVEQRLIREFRSPFPGRYEKIDGHLIRRLNGLR
ncbi:hypothetical protein FHW37_1275 [Neorhizobium alkalisoli]|jgi:hypothetical protein|uniref:Uncharacterized protein n=1 Tax=Neorhizobium alkalisoli TaxID=528178 RepID=A0A561PSV8_9HYPH|nr:hypothetical protein FHW37_1275 [Neorhizobium alkalisoli]